MNVLLMNILLICSSITMAHNGVDHTKDGAGHSTEIVQYAPSHLSAALTLVHTLQLNQIKTQLFSQAQQVLNKAYVDKVKGATKGSGNIEKAQKVLSVYTDKLNQAINGQINDEEINQLLSKIYARHYTQVQLVEINAFLTSETGALFLSQSPVLSKATMQIGQQYSQKFLPTFQSLLLQMQTALEVANP